MNIFSKVNFIKMAIIPRSFSTTLAMKEINVNDKENGVFHVQLNRPDNRNSFTLELWE